nr:reverse transcriptase domain-containing protein [Tanacetum cinerariifolium]
MADQRTMAELLRAPTEGYAEAIVVPLILAEQFELKHSLINMMTMDQFFGLEKDNPHDHIRWGSQPMARKRTPAYKDLLRACPHHSFTKLHQLDTFYNALNPADQDSLDAAAGRNLLERSTHDVLTIIENKSKFQATPPPAPVKAVEETCVTCGGAHPYYQCLTAGGNTFPELRDNIQGYVLAAAVNYNQGNPGYRPSGLANQIRPPGSGSLPSNIIANPKGELKATTTRNGHVIDGPTQEKDEVQIHKFWQLFKQLYINITLVDALILMPKYQKMLKALLSNKEKLQELANTPLNENCSADILKKLLKKLRDPRKFLIPYGFSELKCKALTDLGASINLMPLSVWKKLGLPEFIPTRMTLERANRAICTPAGIARDVFVLVGKFTFLADFVIVDYESDPRVPFILGRPFLRTARALIDVHGEEMILHDGDEILTLNMRNDTSSYSNQPQKESTNLINSSEDFLEDLFPNQPSGNPTFLLHPELTSPEVNGDIFDSEGCTVLSEKLLDLDSTKDLHPPIHDNPLSGSTTYFSNLFLEEFANELPPEYDDNLYDEHALDYSSPLIFDEYEDDLEVESDARNVYDDPFDSKGEKIKESKLLIDELDLLRDFLPHSEHDSFISQDFSRVDALPLTNNKDKIFNTSILIEEKPVEIITRVVQDKKLVISNASLVLEDFDPHFYEPLFFKEVPMSKMLLLFSSENEENVFKPGIHTSEKVHSYFIPELFHQGYKVFKINQIFKSLMKIFLFDCGNDTHILAIPYHHFYPLDQFKYGGISIPGNVKTLAKGFCTQVFISSASSRESCIQI